MRVCILGNSLTSLTLAKVLVNQGIFIDVFSENIDQKNIDNRTIGITRSNVNFFNKNILNIEKLLWKLNKIEIFTENLKNQKILNFESHKDELFSIVRNHQLYHLLNTDLKKNKFFKIKKKVSKKYLDLGSYDLVINCEYNHQITKKFFYNKIEKKYNSFAYTTIINHKNVSNDIATQIFTERGPIAFLPISNTETSVVYSINTIYDKEHINLENLIKKYNPKYTIFKINKIVNFELKSIILRSYYYKNILAFGDLLHRLHPLAGQGFNMTIRDVEELLKIIKNKIDLGLPLDSSICVDFEKKTRHKNYIFLNGVDFLYEFFNLERKTKSKILSKSIQLLGKNKILNKIFTKIADGGLKL